MNVTQHPREVKAADARWVAILAGVVLLAAGVRAAYAAGRGSAIPWLAVTGGAAFVAAVAAAAGRWGRFASLYASLAAALTPAFVTTPTLSTAGSWALAAAATALFLFDTSRLRRQPVAALGAGVSAAVALVLLPTAVVIPASMLIRSLTDRTGIKRVWWGGAAFLATTAAAFIIASHTLVSGLPWQTETPFPPFSYETGTALAKRIGMGAAGELLWNGHGFGPLTITAFAGVISVILRRSKDLVPYALAFVLSLLVFDVTPTTTGTYHPLSLQPLLWTPAYLPACLVLGASLAQLHAFPDVRTSGVWVTAWGTAFLVAAVFLNGTLPHAVINLAVGAAVTLLMLGLHGWLSRQEVPPSSGPAYALLTTGVLAAGTAALLT